ncbi:LCP family protein [Saccharomonospora iraqiensis]|uniref:LCP family protein n=1 Tax=Saccharomonospora iraqiensis TaxID=52698 RepID=UPI00041EF1EA|nr:LCP family protein [Saccharomonospora iraqiensis]
MDSEDGRDDADAAGTRSSGEEHDRDGGDGPPAPGNGEGRDRDDAPDPGDTADPGDTGESGGTADTGDIPGSGDASESGDTPDPGDAPGSGDEAPDVDARAGGNDDGEHGRDGGDGHAVPSPVPRTEREAPDEPRRRTGAAPARGAARTLAALSSVLVLVVTGYAHTMLDSIQNGMNTTDAVRLNAPDAGDGSAGDGDDAARLPEDDGATDILLVGADARTDMQGNPLPYRVLKQLRTESKPGVSTDTLILLRFPDDGSAPTGISIPRDSWVDVPDGGHDKINAVYGDAKRAATSRLRAEGVTDDAELNRRSDQDGRWALVRTVQELTRVRVDHYAEVNLLGFYLLTEALGGVRVCLNHATSDPDSGANFRAGPQVVSGGEALSFVRQRKNLPRGDLDRITRQQVFLASALDTVLSAGTLTDSDRLAKLTDAVRRSLVLDSDLDLLGFADRVKGIASGDITFTTVPVEDITARSPDGRQSIVRVDPAAVREFVAAAVGRGDAPDTPSGGGSGPVGIPVPRQITADDVPCVN